MPKNRVWTLLAVFSVVLALLVTGGCGKPAVERAEPSGLTIQVIDVGQGDAILIRTPGQQVTLIDTGDVPARNKLVAYIKKQGVIAIDNLIITHPHADHLGGAQAILENFPVKHVYDNGQTTTTALYRQYLTLIQKKQIPFEVVKVGGQLDLGGGAILTFYGPPSPPLAGAETNLNNASIVGRLSFGKFSMLLPGDAELEEERWIVKRYGGELQSQVLKSGHHGSRTSSSLGFLKAVRPEAAIASLGAGNDYHHPHPSTIRRYEDYKIKFFRTDTDGTVTITSDGETYTITKEK
ncbi:MAG TPA: ComEC/Rec2 family competence protein [Selenomonadales bacterium]|nr:ComEC/Rec2 family competence protein [Selenomonadales bacterium]